MKKESYMETIKLKGHVLLIHRIMIKLFLKDLQLKRLHVSIVFLSLFACQVNPGVIIRIYWLAKVDSVLELLTEHTLTRVSRHLQKEEAGVGFGQIVVWGRVFVKHLKTTHMLADLNWNPLQLYCKRNLTGCTERYCSLLYAMLHRSCKVISWENPEDEIS